MKAPLGSRVETGDEPLTRMADRLRVLGHPDRLRLLAILETEKAAPVHVLTERLGQPQAAVSRHLAQMRRAGILQARRHGQEVWYTVADPHAFTILRCIRNHPPDPRPARRSLERK